MLLYGVIPKSCKEGMLIAGINTRTEPRRGGMLIIQHLMGHNANYIFIDLAFK